ncbi:predicted protein [Naegleria gruberi]|uniref:Predicted protein n=1 Tax=Naegleria gruberi TaxID=5762 RepID=D2VIP1_NAEGR|nr:uncharacterized protein NAEGRDRAFT_68746 [Naegleria gruberi]EFC43386.1 predicted protein [Naegleria gruberi]|eukprot:XP_002676130.1 predicted protein [Naegleria gruberi strain NEG-M]
MMQPVNMNAQPTQQQTSAYTPQLTPPQQQEVVVVYINNDPVQNQTTSTTVAGRLVDPIAVERKQKNFLIIASFFLSLFFFLLVASLSLYVVFIFVLNFRTSGGEENQSIEHGNFTNLYGWPLWLLVISLTLFMISLIMFVHRYRAYSVALRRKMLFITRRMRGVGNQQQHVQQDESSISISTDKPADPSTIALAEDPLKSHPNSSSQIEIKDNRVLPSQSTQHHHSNDDQVVEYIHNPNVVQ